MLLLHICSSNGTAKLLTSPSSPTATKPLPSRPFSAYYVTIVRPTCTRKRSSLGIINWFAKCCGGQRGPWRTPKSGLTWFNIVWIGVYQYCFIRVAMTITAVLTQHFGRYCESSNSPVFAHIWVSTPSTSILLLFMYKEGQQKPKN
jgi:hypothetical protein